MRKSREPWLDWDSSLELAEDSRHKARSKRSTKTLFWARFWLVLGLGFFSNIYLRRSLPAFLWLMCLLAYNLFSVVLSEFAKQLSGFNSFLLTVLILLPYFLVIVVEWVQLPKRVRKFNERALGKNNLTTDELRGGIGRYAILKKHFYTVVIVFVLSLAAFEIGEYKPSNYAIALTMCLLFLAQLLALSFVVRAYNLSQKSKSDLESHD